MTTKKAKSIRPEIQKGTKAEAALTEIMSQGLGQGEAVSRLLSELGSEYAAIIAKARSEGLAIRDTVEAYRQAGRKAIGLKTDERPQPQPQTLAKDERTERLTKYLIAAATEEQKEKTEGQENTLKALTIGALNTEEIKKAAYYIKRLFNKNEEELTRLRSLAETDNATTAALWLIMSEHLERRRTSNQNTATYYIYHGKAYESRAEAEEAEAKEREQDLLGTLARYKPYKAGITNLESMLEGYTKIIKKG